MKTTMTERDKKLLVGMLIGVIIVAVGYWGILPQVKQYRALSSKIEKEENIKKLNKTKILNKGTIEGQADNYEQLISERCDEFYPIMNSSEIDRMMTEMATDNNLNVYDLNFNMPSDPTARLAYQNSELYLWQQDMIKEYNSGKKESSSSDDLLSDSSGEKDDKENSSKKNSKEETQQDVMKSVMGGEEGGYQPNTDIYAVPVTITVGGSIEDLERFMEHLNSLEKRTLVVGYSWGEFRDIIKRDLDGNIISSTSSETDNSVDATSSNDSDAVTVEVVTKKSLTVRMEIYMCDTSDVASSTDASEE